jgi:hypothetical protein
MCVVGFCCWQRLAQDLQGWGGDRIGHPPLRSPDASLARAMAAFGAGCASGTAAASTCLLRYNALSGAADHSSVFLPPLRAAVGGGGRLQDCCDTWCEAKVEVDHAQVAL